MEDEFMMSAFVVIGLTIVATAIVGVGLPSDHRLAVLLPLIGGAGAGVSSFAIAILVIPDTAWTRRTRRDSLSHRSSAPPWWGSRCAASSGASVTAERPRA